MLSFVKAEHVDRSLDGKQHQRLPKLSDCVACCVITRDKVGQLLPHSQDLFHLLAHCCIPPLLQELPVLLSKLGVLGHQRLVRLPQALPYTSCQLRSPGCRKMQGAHAHALQACSTRTASNIRQTGLNLPQVVQHSAGTGTTAVCAWLRQPPPAPTSASCSCMCCCSPATPPAAPPPSQWLPSLLLLLTQAAAPA